MNIFFNFDIRFNCVMNITNELATHSDSEMSRNLKIFIQLRHIARKHPLPGYFLGVLVHTTALVPG